MVLEHLKYNDQLIRMNVAERLIIDFVGDNSHKEQLVVIVPNDNFLFPLALELFHLDYSVGYKNRMDFGRRASVLIMTDKLSTSKYLFDRALNIAELKLDSAAHLKEWREMRRHGQVHVELDNEHVDLAQSVLGLELR